MTWFWPMALGIFKVVAGFMITVLGLAIGLTLFWVEWMNDPRGALSCIAFAVCFLTSGLVCTVSGVKDCNHLCRP